MTKRWLKLLLPPNRPLRWILPIFILLAAISLQVTLPEWSETLEGRSIDLRFQLRGPRPPQYPIFIIAIDEASFQMLGNLQGENVRMWPRARWADLVKKIASGRPHVIGLDVSFDTPGWDPGGDEALAKALDDAQNVVLAAHISQTTANGVSTSTYSPPWGLLDETAKASGFVSLIPDADGVYRKEHIFWDWSGNQLVSFRLIIASLYNGKPINIDRASLGKDLGLPVNFRGPEQTFRTVSLYQVLNGEVPASTFKDAIILIGYTTLLEQDRHPAPFASTQKMPGVEINANIIDTLLTGDWLHRPPEWLTLLLPAVAGLLALLLTSLPRPNLGLVLLTLLILSYLLAGVLLFNSQDFLLPLSAPLLTALLVGGASTAERMIFAERDKRQLQQRFSGLMSPERLQVLMDNWQNLLNIERPEKQASVLFCDIRGFTHATESLMRDGRSPEMVRFLNAYMDMVSQAVFAEGGVIYRTFGDGLLVLFGLPEALPGHARHAVRAALRIALSVPRLAELWPLQTESAFEMGVGVNSGAMVDAIMGRGRRFDYTVLGDAVNTAARIEAHCKLVMDTPRPPGNWQVPATITILLGGDLYAQVKEIVLADEQIPPFEARGKSERMKVVRLLGLKESEVL